MSPISKLRKQLGVLVSKVSPDLLEAIRALIRYRSFKAIHGPFQATIQQRLYPDSRAITVLAGPFAGMNYFNRTGWGSLTSRWLGTYEKELHGWVKEITSRGYRRIIDLGCAEGFYAVGFARSIPQSEVYAFDTDMFSRHSCRLLAKLNACDRRVIVQGFCTPAILNDLAGRGILVFCDVEGNELDLLDPQKCPALAEADIVVEVHCCGARPATEVELVLSERFGATHDIEKLHAEARTVEDADPIAGKALSAAQLVNAMDEERTDGRIWLRMMAK